MWRLWQPLKWIWGTVISGVLITALANFTLYGQPIAHISEILEEYPFRILTAFSLLLALTACSFRSQNNRSFRTKSIKSNLNDLTQHNRSQMLEKVRFMW